MASAVLPLSGLQLGVETTKGTAVATTRELYPSSTGYFDPGFIWDRHEGAQRGTFGNITHATLKGYLPTIGYTSEPSHGLTYDELPIIMSQLKAGLTGTGASADKAWTVAKAGATTATYDTYTFNAFDGSQAFEFAYGFMTRFTISGGFDDLTQTSWDIVGRQASKVTVDAVAANNAVKIPSGLWTLKYAAAQASLTGASAYTNTMRNWELAVDLPQNPRFYGDGNLYFGQGVASRNLGGTLTMTWDSNSDAVAMYDLFAAGTPAFFRLQATGPALGGTTYIAGPIDVCVILDPVTPLASESDGVMEYTLVGHLAYDATWAAVIDMSATCSIAALP